MPDKEKVIKGLECHADRTNLSCNTIKCPYYELDFCGVILSQDALALLKEQEDSIRIMSSDLEDWQKEHEKLLNKKIPLITNGQEVVRCKDCKHGEKVNSVYLCGKSRGFGIAHEPDWFCADGERAVKRE